MVVPSAFAQKQLNVADYDSLTIQYRFSIPDSGIYYANKGLQLARKLRDLKGQGMMHIHLGIIDENQGRFESGRRKYLQAITAYKQGGFISGIATATIRLGVTEMRKANFDKAIAYFLDALRMHQRDNNQAGIMECYDVLGEAYMGQSNWKQALTYLLKGDEISKRVPLSGITLYIYNNLGVVYTQLGDIKTAEDYLQKGLNLSNEPKYEGLHITLLNSLAMAYTKNGKRDQAISLQQRALAQARKIKNYLREIQTLNGLADNYSEANPDKALLYLQEALTLSQQKKADKVTLETINRIAKLYEFKGDYKQALNFTKRGHTLADSIFNLTKATEIANLQANYELQQSRSNVERLQLLNRQQKNQQYITISIAAGIVLVLLVLAYYYVQTRKLNTRLSQLNEDLQASNAVKDKIFSVIGHDLRTPLATVRNFLQILDTNVLTAEEQAEVIKALSDNCDASLNVLNQLLRWGQMQIKGVLINPKVFNANAIIANNVNLFASAIKEKAITVSVVTDVALMLNADADHFDFIVRNLLSNAVKFSNNGGTITIGNTDADATGFLSIFITDSGVGISREHVQDIFSRNNVSMDGTHGEKGTSLGLLMCREYVEANGGTITVESMEGRGATFTFTVKAV